MAKKTTRKKSKKPSVNADRNRRLIIAGSVVVAGIGTCAAGMIGLNKLDQFASESLVDGSIPVVIHWPMNGEHSWMPLAEQEQIQLLIERSIQGGRALSSGPLKEAGLALKNSAWINGLPEVKWNANGEIELKAQWRVPAAAVRVGNREIIIDWNRHVLPLDYAVSESQQFYFVNAEGQLPRIGEQWPGTMLQDGVELLKLLENNGLLDQIEGCDLSGGTMTLLTTRGSRVVWGAGPGRERPSEELASRKIRRLQELRESTGFVDGRFDEVDITGVDIFVNP